MEKIDLFVLSNEATIKFQLLCVPLGMNCTCTYTLVGTKKTAFDFPLNGAIGTRIREFLFHSRPDLGNIRSTDEAIVIGVALSLSSSAFVLQFLAGKGELRTRFGSATLEILLLQEDFNGRQYIKSEELKLLERWVAGNTMDKLKFTRQKATYCFFSTFSPSELSDAYISWAKIGILTTVVDYFFDIGGFTEKLLNLIQLIEKNGM